MGTEAKAKVVASVLGAKFDQFLAALSVLPRSIWKNKTNSTVSSKSTEAKQLARQIDATTFALASVPILLL